MYTSIYQNLEPLAVPFLVLGIPPTGWTNWSTFIFQLVKWDQLNFASSMGPAAVELLAAGLEGYATQAKRVEELFGKIWPPPNVWE